MGDDNMREKAFKWLEKEFHKTHQARQRSLKKPGVTQEELENLSTKEDIICWIKSCVVMQTSKDQWRNPRENYRECLAQYIRESFVDSEMLKATMADLQMKVEVLKK
jgi:hypothetical protein